MQVTFVRYVGSSQGTLEGAQAFTKSIKEIGCFLTMKVVVVRASDYDVFWMSTCRAILSMSKLGRAPGANPEYVGRIIYPSGLGIPWDPPGTTQDDWGERATMVQMHLGCVHLHFASSMTHNLGAK